MIPIPSFSDQTLSLRVKTSNFETKTPSYILKLHLYNRSCWWSINNCKQLHNNSSNPTQIQTQICSTFIKLQSNLNQTQTNLTTESRNKAVSLIKKRNEKIMIKYFFANIFRSSELLAHAMTPVTKKPSTFNFKNHCYPYKLLITLQ